MTSRLLWILIFGIVGAVIVLVVRHEAGTVGPVSTGEFASLVFLVSLLLFIGSGIVVIFRRRLSEALEAALFWIVAAAILAVGYTYRYELKSAGERVLAELMPGYGAARGRSVEIARGRAGEFRVATLVNGAPVPMILDTGASAVVLTQEAAKAAGLPLEVLSYTVSVDTANGRTRAAPVTLDRIAVGDIVERSVPALIAQPGQLKSNLLGMSFLNRLQGWEVRGEKLILRGYP